MKYYPILIILVCFAAIGASHMRFQMPLVVVKEADNGIPKLPNFKLPSEKEYVDAEELKKQEFYGQWEGK